MKLFSIFYIILFLFFTGCSTYNVEVEEKYHPNQKYVIDDDFDSLNLNEIDKKIFMQDLDRCSIESETTAKKYIYDAIKNNDDNLAKCLINTKDNLINTQINNSTPLLIALESNNKEMIRFIIAKDLDLSLEDYTYAALKNGYADLSFKFFKKTYALNHNDYALGLKEFSVNNNLNIDVCNLEASNQALNKFLSDIQSNGKLDISYYCKKNNYFTLLAFSKENQTYKSQQVKKELDILLKNNALKSYKVALVYLKKYPNTVLASKVKNKLEYLMYDNIMKNNSYELAEKFMTKYPRSKYRNKILATIYKYSHDSIALLELYIKKYPINKALLLKAKDRLEYLKYEQVINNDSLALAREFLTNYPHSKHLLEVNKKIFIIKKNQAMQEIKNNYFFNKWDSLYWSGNFDKDGWPDGEGTFYISKNLVKGNPIGRGKVDGEITVNVTFRNHQITKGKASAYLKLFVGLGAYDTTATYSETFEGVRGMNNAIVDTFNKAIESRNGQTIQKRHAQGSKCNVIYNKCMSSCNKKSSKGFFNDKDSCQNACRGGKSSCESGDYSLGKITSCRGICKGVSASDGDLFGWGASSFDKCVDSCTDGIGN